MLFNGKATDTLRDRPMCDLCRAATPPERTPAAVDGKTLQGPWGYLCVRHHTSMGVGLGEGRGQVLLCGDEHDQQLAKTYRLEPTTARERAALATGLR
jgi:hypothetical protein